MIWELGDLVILAIGRGGSRTAFTGSDAANDLGAVFDHLFCVEGTFRTSDPLHDQFGVFVYNYGHSVLNFEFLVMYFELNFLYYSLAIMGIVAINFNYYLDY